MKRPGRPAVSSPYKKWRLSADGRIIKALKEKQPQTILELVKNAGVSRSQVYNVLPLLVASGLVKETHEGYVLWTYEEFETVVERTFLWLMKNGPLSHISERVLVEAIEGVTFLFTDEEIALELGKPWSEIEQSVYALMKKHGLRFATLAGKRYVVKPR